MDQQSQEAESSETLKTPDRFLEVVVQDLSKAPELSGFSVGYETGQWRTERLAEHLIEWLPEFALKWSELKSMNSGNSVALFRKAARIVYSTDKYKRRGEFGELILHCILRQFFGSVPAVSKIYYKDNPNDTVKGFDSVHVVVLDDRLELWMGEAKFFDNIDNAISSVVGELEKHTKNDYLRNEFTLIANKLEPAWPQYANLQKLLHPNTSLDEIFACACIPVLLTYDSKVVNSFAEVSKEYKAKILEEISANYKKFASKKMPEKIRLHLCLLPLKSKNELVGALHERLKAGQTV